jgi:hypothetical protein
MHALKPHAHTLTHTHAHAHAHTHTHTHTRTHTHTHTCTREAHPEHAVHDEAIGHAARLRALPTVGAAPAPGLAAEALPAVAHAQRAVAEGLHLCAGGAGHARDLSHRQLAAHDHARHAQA